MNERVKTELDNIVRALANTGVVSQIFLFGSYASGEETPESDIDLCILTPQKVEDQFKAAGDFRTALRGVRTMPLDLFAFNYDEFYEYTDSPASFQYEIAKNGVLLYEHN